MGEQDFTALSEEEQKEIGWFDVDKLAILNTGDDDRTNGENIKNFKKGFQKAQELLSDRFTLEDFHRFLDLHTDSAPIKYLKKELVKFLYQPKFWNVELEKEDTELKLTNGKVKILRLLNH